MNRKPSVLQLVAEQKPTFQLKTGNAAVRSSEELFFQRGATQTKDLVRASHELEAASAAYLASILQPDHATLEVGGGVSTVVFAAAVSSHTCINPDVTANQMIHDFIDKNGLASADLTFIELPSDAGLPPLELAAPLDVALIDGSHSFPFPVIDWHYIDRHIKVGGILLVDNCSINAVRMLCDHLRLDPAYDFVVQHGDCTVWTKVQRDRVMGWGDQAINRQPYVGYRKLDREYIAARIKSRIPRTARRHLRSAGEAIRLIPRTFRAPATRPPDAPAASQRDSNGDTD